MSVSINVISILNDEQQLGSLPVGESIDILLSAEPDLYDIDRHVAIVRIDSSQDAPNFTDIVYRIQDESEYGTVPSSFSINQLGNQYVLTVTPEEFLTPNSNYYLIVGKDLAPLSYEVVKTVSIGPSLASIIMSPEGNSEDAIFEVEVTSQSNLSDGQHSVSFSVAKDAVPFGDFNLNLKGVSSIELNSAVSLSFNPNVPFLLGEKFEVTLEEINRLGDTKAQAFSTFLTSDVIENVEETSNKLNQQQILEFYENSKWSQEFDPTDIVEPAENAALFEFLHPNKVLITLSEPVQASSVVPEAFSINMDYAFGNYLLPSMGYYSEDKKYVVTYKALSTPLTDKILLQINDDTNGQVPTEDKFIVVSA
jgi:hypothetical protein